VEVTKVNFKTESNKPAAEAELCLVFIGKREEDFIEVVFRDRVQTGELGGSIQLKVMTDSAEFEPQG